MPQVKLTFADEASIPAELKAFKAADNTVTIWAGDNVAAETNAGLAANRDALKAEKDKAEALLETEKANWTKTNSTLASEVESLRVKVATGSKMTAEEVALLEAVKPFATKPEEIKTLLESGKTATAENTQLKREVLVKNVASIAGWKESVLLDLLNHPEKSKDLELLIEDTTVDGKTVKAAFVNQKDATGVVTKKELRDFVQSNESWAAYLPILTTDGKGPEWITQTTPSHQSPMKDEELLKKHIADRNKASENIVNPLRPASAPIVASAGA